MSSKRLQILQELETQLRTITIEDGYNIGVKLVTRKIVMPADASEKPRVQIIADTEDIANEIQNVAVAYNNSEFRFRLLNYLEAETDVTDSAILGDVLENHIEDVKKCLWAAPTLGLSFVKDFGLTFIDQYNVWAENVGIVVMNGFYSFSWDGANP